MIDDVKKIITERNAALDYIKKLEEFNDNLLKVLSQVNAPKPFVVCDLCHAKLISKHKDK